MLGGCGTHKARELRGVHPGSGLERIASTSPLEPWVAVQFTDPRNDSEYLIADRRVIISCKNAPELPEMDPNYFDDQYRDLSAYYADIDEAIAASGGFCELEPEVLAETDLHAPDPELQEFIDEEELEVLAHFPEFRGLCALLPEGQTVEDAVENWPDEYSDLIASVDPDAIVTYDVYPHDPPNDEMYAADSGIEYDGTGEYKGQWNLFGTYGIGMEEVWPTYEPPVVTPEHPDLAVIAILDTGVETPWWDGVSYPPDYEQHADLAANSTEIGCNSGTRSGETHFDLRRAQSADGSGRPYNSWVQVSDNPITLEPLFEQFIGTSEPLYKVVGHGTGVAGVCSATINNDQANTQWENDAAGITNWQQYFPVALDNRGWLGLDQYGTTTISYLNGLVVVLAVKGIIDPDRYYPEEEVPRYNIEAVNMSFSRPLSVAWEESNWPWVYKLERQAIALTARYVVLVASAGNVANDLPRLPAAYPEVISVTAHDPQSYGWGNYAGSVDISAPGTEIFSTDMCGYYNGNDTQPMGDCAGSYPDPAENESLFRGTSFAVPHVAAVAAMLADIDPYPEPGTIRSYIVNNTKYLPQSFFPGLDAAAAIAAAQ